MWLRAQSFTKKSRKDLLANEQQIFFSEENLRDV
jgi:hypothetical protein